MATLKLHEIDDVTGFCAHIATLYCARSRTNLNAADYDDLIQYLTVECWRLSERFQPTTPKARFRPYAQSQLNYRCVDWLRTNTHNKRTKWQWSGGKVYERERVVLVSIDKPLHGDNDDSGTLADTLVGSAGDLAADRGSALDWLVRAGDSETHRDLAILRYADTRLRKSRTRPRAANA